MAKQNKTKWDALSMKDRASFIRIGIKNGFTDLEEIKDKYNIYANGGDTNGGDKEEIKRDDDWKINLASKVLSSGLIPDRLKKRAIELGMRMSGGDPSPAKMSDIQSYLNTSSGRDLIIKALITKTPIKELLDNQFFNDEDLAAQLYNSGASQEKISEILGPYLAMENYGGLSPNNDFIDMDVGAFIGEHPNDYDFVETYLYNKIPFESSGVIKIDDKDSTRLGRYKDYINKNYKERYIPTYQGHVDTLDMNLVKDLNLKSLNKETSTYGVSTDETLPFEFGNKEGIRGYYDAGGYNLELIRGKDGKIYGRKSDIYDFLPKDFTNKWGEELNSTYKQFIPILDGVGNPFIFRSPWFDAAQIYIPEKIMQNFNKKHDGGPIKYDANNAGKYEWTIDDSINLIKQFEGFRNKAYQLKDGNGNEQWLGGYGHALTPEEIGLYSKENAVIPDEVINGWLEKDIQEKRKNIKTFYGENISEHLEALLLSLAYHGGDKLIRGPRESDNTKGKGWSPNFEKAVNAYILDPSIANIDAVIEQMQYRDDVLGEGKDGLTSRYGLYRAMFDGTADPSKIAEYYKNNTFRHYRSNKVNIKDTGGELDGFEGLPVFMYRPEYIQQAAQDYITNNQVFGDYNIPEVEVSRKGKKLPSVNSKEGKERIKFLAQRIANGDSTLDAVPTKYKKNVKRYLSGIEFGKEVAKREGYEGLQAFATAAPLAAVPGIFSTMAAATPSASAVINSSSLMNPITKGQLAKQLALDMGWGITGYEGTNQLSEWMTGKPFNQAAYDQITSGLSPEDVEMNREWGEAVLDMANPGGWLGLNNARKVLDAVARIELPHQKYGKLYDQLAERITDIDSEMLKLEIEKQKLGSLNAKATSLYTKGYYDKPIKTLTHASSYSPLHTNNKSIISREFPDIPITRVDDRTLILYPEKGYSLEQLEYKDSWGTDPEFRTSRSDISEVIPKTNIYEMPTSAIKLVYPKSTGGTPKIQIMTNGELLNLSELPIQKYVTLPASVRKVLEEETNSALQALGTKSGDVKIFGSSAPAQKGFLPHIPDEVDVITTRRTYDERISRLPLYDKDSGTAKHHQYTFSGTKRKVDVNIIDQDISGMATGELATQLFWKEFPEEFWKQARIAAEKGIPMRITKTPEELLESFDPVEDTILDAFISTKPKHMSRVSTYLEQGDLTTMQRVLQRKGKMLYGEGYVPLTTDINYSNTSDNLEFLQAIDYKGISLEEVIHSPERMALIMEEFYQSLGVARTVGKDYFDDALTRWSNVKMNGENIGGLNTVGIKTMETHIRYGWQQPIAGIISVNINPYIQGKSPLEVVKYLDMLEYDKGIPLPNDIATKLNKVMSAYLKSPQKISTVLDLSDNLQRAYRLSPHVFSSFLDDIYNIIPYIHRETNSGYIGFKGLLSTPNTHVVIPSSEISIIESIGKGYKATGDRGHFTSKNGTTTTTIQNMLGKRAIKTHSMSESNYDPSYRYSQITNTLQDKRDKIHRKIEDLHEELSYMTQKQQDVMNQRLKLEDDEIKLGIITGIIAGMLGIGYTGYKMYDNSKIRKKDDLEQK